MVGLASARERAECEMLMASNARREVEEEQSGLTNFSLVRGNH